MATPALFIRLTHTGISAHGAANDGPVLVNDLDVGYEFQHRKVPCYVPRWANPPTNTIPGYIDIPLSSRSMLSYEDGVISRFKAAGVLLATMFIQPEAYSNVTRPDADTYPVGASVWNTDDNAYNYSDGVAWRDAMGVLT